MDRNRVFGDGGEPMRKPRTKDSSKEGRVSYPPRFASEAIDSVRSPHQIEQDVQRELLAQPSFRFASLVVRRIDNGVCLQGILEADDESPDVCSVAQRVAGVQNVLNRLVVAPRRELPRKG